LTLPLYCVNCQQPIEVAIAPMGRHPHRTVTLQAESSDDELDEPVSTFACPLCKQLNHGRLGGMSVAVRTRVDRKH
jgi:hypothetical protein